MRREQVGGGWHYEVCERVIVAGEELVKVLADLYGCSSIERRIIHLERQALEYDWDAASLEDRPSMIGLDPETAAAGGL